MDAAYFSEHDTIHYSDGGTPNISKSFSRDSLTMGPKLHHGACIRFCYILVMPTHMGTCFVTLILVKNPG